MTLLWLAIALMTTVMLLLFIVPLRMAKNAQTESLVRDQSELNTQVFKEHVAQLEQDFSENLIDQASFDEQKRELEDRYLLDMKTDGTSLVSNSISSKSFLALLAIGVISSASALVTYNKLGVSNADLEMAENLKQVSDLSEEELLTRLEQQLKENPERLDGHLLLARTYLTLGRTKEAVQPLRSAVELAKGTPGEPMILANLAQAVYFSDPSVVTDEVQGLIDQALELDPQEPTALGLAGIFAFEKEDYQTAIIQWQKILAMVGDGPNADSLRQGIVNAQRRLDEASGIVRDVDDSSQQSTQATSSSFEGVTVAVGVTEAVKSQHSDTTTIFVYARHANGPRMPLSIQTVTLGDLPIELVLDDTTSMAGMSKLSDAKSVEIVARLSTSGSAMPSEGDVEVVSSAISLEGSRSLVVLELAQ